MRTRLMQVGFTATYSHGGVWACATSESHDRVHGPAIVGICVNVHSPYYHLSLCRCPCSGLLPENMMSVYCAATRGHADVSGLCCHQGSCLVHGPTAAGGCVHSPVARKCVEALDPGPR